MTTGRRPPGFMTEDIQPTVSGGPAKYTSKTDKSIDYIALADEAGAIIGYIYANDEDVAAGWVPHAKATPAQQNLAVPWIALLRDARKRGINPTAALEELLIARPANKTRAVEGLRGSLPSIGALKILAAH